MLRGRRVHALVLAVATAALCMAVALPAFGAGTALEFKGCLVWEGGTTCASHDNEGLRNADAVAVSPDGKNVYVAGQTDGTLVTLDRDGSTGALTWAECFTTESSGCGTHHDVGEMTDAQGVAVSPDGKSVYVTGFSSSGVSEFERNTSTGALTYKGCKVAGTGACGAGNEELQALEGAWGIAVSPGGESVYVVGNLGNAIERFNRDTSTGALTAEECFSAHFFCGAGAGAAPGLEGPIGVAVSTDGSSVYVAAGVPGTVGSITTFTRASGGALTPAGCKASGYAACGTEVAGLLGAAGVVVSPDDKNVYVAAESSGTVTDYGRNTTTGALTAEGCVSGAASGCASNSIAGLLKPFGLAVSPDGSSIYVASSNNDDALTRLERDTATGALSPGECFTHQSTASVACGSTHAGLPGLNGAKAVAAGPDGKNVYVAALSEGAVSVFGPGAAVEPSLTVTKTGTGSGYVASVPAGIDCGPTCTHSFAGSTHLTLTATPETGSTFAGWSGGGCSGTATCAITLEADTVVTATFETIPTSTEPHSPGGESTPPASSVPPPAPVTAPAPVVEKKPLVCKKGFVKKKVKDKEKCVARPKPHKKHHRRS